MLPDARDDGADTARVRAFEEHAVSRLELAGEGSCRGRGVDETTDVRLAAGALAPRLGEGSCEARAQRAERDEEIDATLAADPDVELLAAIESRQIGPRVRQVPSKLWGIGCAVLLGLITAQLVHHFRAPLASRSLVGPLVQETYGFLGLEVQPDWDLAQYEILNWSAKAGAGTTTGIGNLQITAQIRNNGPRAQPYPRIRLELKDRWEAIVGSRVFGPGDYLPDDIDLTGRMPVGATVPAGLEIIDPGADASGFELDICLEVDAGGLRCAADRVFQ
jgi:hypothetical protein